MNKFIFNDYFHEPQGKIAKRMLFKSDNVIAFILNIAKGEILPGHTHLESTLFLQVMEGNAKIIKMIARDEALHLNGTCLINLDHKSHIYLKTLRRNM